MTRTCYPPGMSLLLPHLQARGTCAGCSRKQLSLVCMFQFYTTDEVLSVPNATTDGNDYSYVERIHLSEVLPVPTHYLSSRTSR